MTRALLRTYVCPDTMTYIHEGKVHNIRVICVCNGLEALVKVS
jgi:hypothetical protein